MKRDEDNINKIAEADYVQFTIYRIKYTFYSFIEPMILLFKIIISMYIPIQ